MSPKPPSRIDRETFDRVLKRAAELQASGHDVGDAGMTEEEVLALGEEVGLPPAQLRQALMEERARATPLASPGVLDRVIAPAEFQAERVVQGTPESVGAALTKWLERREHLVTQRASVERITYEPMHYFAGAMRRASAVFDASVGKPYLDKADLVGAVITPLRSGFCHVTLNATLRKQRSSYIAGAAALIGVGVTGAGIIAASGGVGLIPLIPLVFGGGLSLTVLHHYHPQTDRARIGLERALDALEQTPSRPNNPSDTSAGALIGREVGEAVRQFTAQLRIGKSQNK